MAAVVPPADYAPATGVDAWRDAVAILKAESEVAEGAGRAALLTVAGRIASRRLREDGEADRLLGAATTAGERGLDHHRFHAEVRSTLNRPTEQEQSLLEVARLSTGIDRAEAYLEAALIAWRRRERPTEAVAYLREGAKTVPDDYTSRALLRALLPTIGGSSLSERIDLLDDLARLSEGGIASDGRVEQATLAEEAKRPDQVRKSLEAALEAEPGHTTAFQRLERLLADDHPARAALYEREANRPGQPDAGWWKLAAARAWFAAGRGPAAVEAFSAAVDAGYTFALRELEGTYLRVGAFRELEDVLVREVAALSVADGQAFALFRLGWLREMQLSDVEGALAAYRQAVALDPAASPAADAVARLLPDAERTLFLGERAASTGDVSERRALGLLLADVAEAAGDLETARARFESVATSGEGAEAEIARDGLDRVLQRTGDVPGLARLRQTRAEATTDVNERVAWLLLAGTVPANRAVALPFWLKALDARPDHPVALAAVAVALELEERGAELAARLKAAGDAATDPKFKAAYLYRAARVSSEQAGDPGSPPYGGAIADVRAALLAAPRLRSARWLARKLHPVRDPSVEAGLYRDQAEFATDPDGRAWARFAAAVLGGSATATRADLEGILAERADHPGALALLEVLMVAERDQAGLVALYRRAIDAATGPNASRLATRTAELLIETRHPDEAMLVLRRLKGVDGAPIRVGARLALQIGAMDRAIELLSSSNLEEDRVERARLLTAAGRAADALPLLMELLTTVSGRVGVAARAAIVAQQLGDTNAMIDAYAAIARYATSVPLRAAYAAWTALQLVTIGREGDALEHWLAALDLRPASTMALLGATRGYVARKEPKPVAALFAKYRPDAGPVLADALARAGDRDGAARVLGAHVAGLDPAPPIDTAAWGQRLATLVELERLRLESEDWQGAYDALVDRRGLCRNPTVRAQADATRRWLLSEKLADTDAAWELYRRLHEDAPYDRQVTDALARIASTRGEVALSIGFLRELAESSSDRAEAARYRRRIGDVHEQAGQVDPARQAYLDALDHVPDDREALDGLRRLAEKARDWPALVAVLQREASSAGRARQIELRREIATVTEDRIKDPKVAIDAWRALLELDPSNREGLEHLLDLAEDTQAWGMFVETGDLLAQQTTGRERAVLLRKIGAVCQDRLGRNDAVRYYDQAVSIQPPDHEAAVRLEGLARSRADWPAVVRALRLQATADVDIGRRVDALLKAARIEIEALHDKEAGSACYRQVLELRPDNEVALRFMAIHLFETKRFDEALPACERLEPIVERDQDLEDFDTRMELSTFYYDFAEILRSRGDDERALPRYERALALNPTHLPTLEAVGPLYSIAKQWSKADVVYRQLLQLSGGHGDKARIAGMYTSLGLIERELGSTDKAYKRFTKALELHPNHVGALKGMALILEDRQDWSNLLNVYNNVIYHATVPEDVVDAYMTKGRILDDQMQRQDKAAQHYQRTLDLDPNQPVAHLRLAELAMRRGAFKEAGELADRALGLDADLVQSMRPLLLVIRAAAWHDAGRTPEAERCLREARMIDASLVGQLGESPLQDLERLRSVIQERLPR
ncbi:MAG: tetratricopeptide repeat protein [Myxococcota bacterium]